MTALKRGCNILALVLVLAGTWQLASAGWIHAKAHFAQHLIASAWTKARAGGPAPRPWPGADLRPIARLSIPARGVDLFILDNASPRALAFGPAHVSGTAAPGMHGNTVIVAHRDTHFSFLRHVALDDAIDLEAAHGVIARYRVREVTIVDQGETRVMDAADVAQLTLITCFPFDAAQPGTTQRYVVIAERVG